MRVADFFCGAGGFSEGFRQAGFNVIFAVDKWLPAVNTHHGNHPKSITIQDDVERISLLPNDEFHSLVPDTEIIIGSPPCVAFSNSNKSGKGDKELGIKLLESYLRIVARKKFKPNSLLKYWILENVPNIEKYIKPIYTAEDLGIADVPSLQVLHENSGIYNSKNFGVAQNRKRFLCGEFPSPQLINIEEEYFTPLRVILESLGNPNGKLNGIINDPNYNFQMLSIDITDHHYIKELARYEWKKAKQLKEDKGYMGKMSFPEDINKPARTVMANSSVSSRESIIYAYKRNRFRLPTIRELASVMSFPIDYRFYGDSRGIKSKLVGNAVPPKMAFSFAKSIAQNLGNKLPKIYIPLQPSSNINFVNLNNTIFPVNVENPKKDTARFKYHIPYLLIRAFRVELTNYNSDFLNKAYEWNVEIHKSQGPKAKIYKPKIENISFDTKLSRKILLFITNLDDELVSFNTFQRYFCMTTEEKIGLLGPNELLESLKLFIVEILKDNSMSNTITIEEEPHALPTAIAIGYVVLTTIISKMRGIADE